MSLSDIPDGDIPTFDMVCAADTVGVFQIESRAQMSMLPRLQPRCYYDLVVEVAIVRPGPIQGGMVHPYLRNRGLPPEAIDCPDELKPALMRTQGVPIFQEQVMQIAMLAADFTAGEADQLRRAMAAWKRKGGLGPFHQRLVGRMVDKGYERDYAERIFKQIEGFGEYGFPESHAASFALLVYASAWLKCHHPDAFLAALLNSQPMGFYAPAQLVRDARAHGVTVLPVDVAVSDWASTLEPAACARCAVRLGLQPHRRLRPRIGRAAAGRARRRSASASPEDLARRAALDAGQLALLARSDALAGLSGHRHQAAWAVAGVDTRATPLLQGTRTHEAAAVLAAPDAAEDMLADYRSIGLSLNTHPLALLRPQLAAYRVQPAAALHGFRNGQLARASGLVTHRQRPETAKGVVFVTLEDETGAVNIIVWPDVAEAQRKPLLGSTLLTVYGMWQREGEGTRSGDAPDRAQAGRPFAAAAGAGHAQPRFSLRMRLSRPQPRAARIAPWRPDDRPGGHAGAERVDPRAGRRPAVHAADILQAMQASGWDDAVARAALAQTLQCRRRRPPAAAAAAAVPAGAGSPVPEPDLRGAPSAAAPARPRGAGAADTAAPARAAVRQLHVRRRMRRADGAGAARGWPARKRSTTKAAAARSTPRAPATACSSSAARRH